MTDAPRVALITGASGGIGLELSRELAALGFHLRLVARSEGKLKALADELIAKHSIGAEVICADLADPNAPAEIIRRAGPLEVLVNNAGFGVNGAFVETRLETELEMIQVNVTALTELTKRVLPGMIERKSGRILNVASTAGFVPGPGMAVYYASKAYVLSLSEALASELKGTGVTVTALCPGPTLSGFTARAGGENMRLFKSPAVLDSATVAQRAVKGMMRGRAIVIPGALNKLGIHSLRVTPRALVRKITASLNG